MPDGVKPKRDTFHSLTVGTMKGPRLQDASFFRDEMKSMGLSSDLDFWPVYWFPQGTIFWAIFVIGHDCGHGSFSENLNLNNIVGHILHSSILVPYHGWIINHRTHHQNHGHVENDESWLPEKIYKNLDLSIKFLRYEVPFPLFAYPLYLIRLPVILLQLKRNFKCTFLITWRHWTLLDMIKGSCPAQY